MEQTLLNVLFLNSWYPNKVLSHNGNFIQQHAKAVSLLANVYCLHAMSIDQEKKFEISIVKNEGIVEVVVYYKKVVNDGLFALFEKKKRQHAAYLKGFQEILKICKSIDIVHLNVVFPAGFFAMFLKTKYKIPFVITEHSTVFLETNRETYNIVQRYYIRKITNKAGVICPVSEDLKKAMRRHGVQGDFQVIPNVVNTSFFRFQKEKPCLSYQILHVSSLKEEHKNVKGILNVVRVLHEKRKDFKFTIIGDGDLNSVRDYMKEIGMDESICELVGKSSLEFVAKKMRESNVFLLFSNYENSPCVISEALVCGLPVVASDVGGISEMLDESNGVLVPAQNELILLKALNQVLETLDNYDNKAIAKKAVARYSYENVAKQFINIYQKTIG